MSNKTVKIFAVLVALLSIVSVFAACSGKDNETALFFKDNGKLYFRKTPQDDAHELVTDKNGETVVDAQGNLLWNLTDAAGKSYTHPVSYPAYIQESGKVSCQQFTMEIPRGWSNIGNEMIMLRSKDSNEQIDYSFFEPDEEGNVPTAQTQLKELVDVMKTQVEAGKSTVAQEKVQVGGRDAICVKIKNIESGKESYGEVYYISVSGGTMSFFCSCEYKDAGKFDFKAILDTIEYRV